MTGNIKSYVYSRGMKSNPTKVQTHFKQQLRRFVCNVALPVFFLTRGFSRRPKSRAPARQTRSNPLPDCRCCLLSPSLLFGWGWEWGRDQEKVIKEACEE